MFFSKFGPEKIERGGWGSGVAGVAGEVREGAYWPEGPGGREVEVYYPEGLTTARRGLTKISKSLLPELGKRPNDAVQVN